MNHQEQQVLKHTSPKIGEILAIWVFSRILIVLLVIAASSVEFFEIPAREGKNFNPNIQLSWSKTAEALARVWSSADANWYFEIAENGYHQSPSTREDAKNWVFFPLFPLLIRAFNTITGSSLLSGLLIANTAFLAALILIVRFFECLGVSNEISKRALWLICFFPTSYFFSSPLTESLFLLLLVASWLLVERNWIILAGLIFGLLSFCRPTGIILLPAFATLLAEKSQLFSRRGIVAMSLAPLGCIVFAGHLSALTGDALAFLHNQNAWGRNQQTPWELFTTLVTQPGELMKPWNFLLLNTAAVALAISATTSLIRDKRYSLALLVLLPTCAAILTGSVQSIARFTMTLFPVFLVLGTWLKREFAERAVLVLFAALLAAMVILYARHVTAAMA